MGISEGLEIGFVISFSIYRLTGILGTEPKQPDIKPAALIFLFVLTLIRSAAFHGLTDREEKPRHGKMTLLQILRN